MPSTQQDLQQTLQRTGDFLALTRANEWSIEQSFSFIVCAKASRQQTLISVLDTGIMKCEPVARKTGKDIVLSSAVHGNETAPIEICAELIQKIILGELVLTERVLFLFGNPAAINLGERFVEENVNRLFSGAHSEDQGQGAGLINKERHRALALENAVTDFFNQGSELAGEGETPQRMHYDLHTAIRGSKNDKFVIYPFRHKQPWKKQQLEFLLACGINTILLSHSPTTTFSYFSSNEFGADAFTVELGKVKPFGQNDMADFVAVKHTLHCLLSGQPLPTKPYNKVDFNIFEIYQTINRYGDDFVFHFSDDVENFSDFPKGYVLASDDDKAYKIKQAGEAIVFPNAKVTKGHRALLTVIPADIEDMLQ
jgi:succinylglutamate desuccinylase